MERRRFGPTPEDRAVDLIRTGGAAIHHRAMALGLEGGRRGAFSGTQRRRQLPFIPLAQEDVFTPFTIRIGDAIADKLGILLDRGGAGHVTAATGVRTADGDIEGPVRKTLENEIVWRDDRGRGPKIGRDWKGAGLHGQ
jgi:hypothetical protein